MLSNLPPEILLLIIQDIDEGDIYSLIQTNHLLHTTLVNHLYKYNIKHYGGEGLLWAAHHGRKRAVEIFLQQGADPNIQIVEMEAVEYIPVRLYWSEYDEKGWFVVHNDSFTLWEAIWGLWGTSRRGSIIKRRSLMHTSPLIAALERGHLRIVEMLLTRDDVNLNSRNANGMTALHVAAMDGREGIVASLLGRDNVNIQIRDISGNTAFDLAVENGYTATVEVFLSMCEAVTFQSSFGKASPLLVAVKNGNESMVRTLLSHTHVYREVISIVRLAPYKPQQMAQILLDGIEKGTLRLFGGEYELEGAARRGDTMMMKILIAHGNINLDRQCYGGASPLAIAAGAGNLDIMQMLLDTGRVDVNSRDHQGDTPLLHALKAGRPVVDLLLAQDGIQYSLNKKGQSAADRALELGHKGLSKFLKRLKIARELEKLR